MRKSLWGFLAIGALVACDGQRTRVAADEIVGPADSKVSVSATDLIARAVALSMSDPALRRDLRNSWRDSRASSDHKVVFSTFLGTVTGKRLLDAMSVHSGRTVAELQAILRELPDFDFYLPIRRHREAWAGGDDVVVGATLNQDSERVTAFRTSGDAVVIEGKDAASGINLVILHPAEPKFPVMVVERLSSGSHIQLPIQQQSTVGVASQSASEVIRSRSSVLTAGVYLRYFDTWRNDGWFGGDLEMEFRSTGYEGGIPFNSGSGFFIYPSTTCNRGIGIGNYPTQPPVQTSLLISAGLTSATLQGCGGMGSPKGYSIWAYEMDGGAGLEDDFGVRFTSPGSLPYGLTVGTTSNWSYHRFYSFPGTTSGQLSVELGLAFQ